MGNKICCEETRTTNPLEKEEDKVNNESINIQPVDVEPIQSNEPPPELNYPVKETWDRESISFFISRILPELSQYRK